MKCDACGGPHRVADCPKWKTKTSSTRRAITNDDAMDCSYAENNFYGKDEVEEINEIYLQRREEAACEAVLDLGAQSFVVGDETLEQYEKHLRLHGID